MPITDGPWLEDKILPGISEKEVSGDMRSSDDGRSSIASNRSFCSDSSVGVSRAAVLLELHGDEVSRFVEREVGVLLFQGREETTRAEPKRVTTLAM